MRFEHPQILWLLLVLPPALTAFFWWSWRQRQRLAAQFIQSRLLPGLLAGISPARRKIRFACLVAATACSVIALARPQWHFDWDKAEQRGLDIVVAVDTSKSMLAADIAPNRLARAKLAALDLMQQARADRLGLVAFAGDAFLECPLTIDDTAFRQSVEALDVNTIPQGGTAFAPAITTALAAFKETDHYKVLVLFTDGEDNDTGALDAAKSAAKAGLKIFTVGIGTAQGDLLKVSDANGNSDYIRDADGNVVKSHLNEALLRQIAESTPGGFYLPLRANTVDELYQHGIAPLPKSDGQEKLIRHYHEQFRWPLALAISLLIIELLLPERAKSGKSSRAAATGMSTGTGLAVVLAVLAIPTLAMASPASAWHDYQSGNFTNALAEYERLAEVRTNDFRLVFNAGAAAYRATNYDEAAKLFQQATLSPDLKLQQKAYYNLGNTLYRASASAKELDALQESWESSVRVYEHAVDLDKQDADAAFNLAFVKNGVEQIKQFREMMLRAKSDADADVRQRNYRGALQIMESLMKNQIAAKQFEDFTKKLKDIDAIATPHQP